MANGRAIGRRLVVVVVLVLLGLLFASGVLPNPLPGIWAWVNEDRPIAEGLAWQERLGARPDRAAVVGDAVAVATGSGAHLFDRATGRRIGLGDPGDWEAAWVTAAGAGEDALLFSSPRGQAGYQVRDPATGRTVGEDGDAAAVWGFRDRWVDLYCDDRRACQLRGYRPGELEPQWRTDLPGARDGMLGGDPELVGPRRLDSHRIALGAGAPEPVPPLLGFPMTRRGEDVVVVVDTRTGQIRQELTQGDVERVVVVGGRVVRSVLSEFDGVCVSEVTGFDAVTGDPVWGPEPYHVWSTGDLGCAPRDPPVAGGSAMAARSPEGRPLVVDAYDGRVLWEGERTEQVEAVSPDLAVIRGADGTARYGVALDGSGERLWERRADTEAVITIAGCGVVVSDREPDRVYVWEPDDGEDRISLSTSGRVLACAADGVLLAEGRSVGFARFDGAEPPATGAGAPDSERPDPGGK